MTTLAGTAGVVGSADGTGAAAQFYYPAGVAVDGTGNVVVADLLNHTIRKIMPGGVVTTLGGSAGVVGSADGVGTAAQFVFPCGVAIDSTGNLYVADWGSNAIRKGQPTGPPTITTQPGNQSVTLGSDVQFSVIASSILALSYQWYFNGSALGGATDSSLNLASVSAANAGYYTVVVTNALGSEQSLDHRGGHLGTIRLALSGRRLLRHRTGYGQYGEGFVRLSITTPDDRVEEAVRRLNEWAATAKK